MTRSWIVDALGERAFEQLANELPGTELQSVLLEVMRRRAAARTPGDVLAQYRRDRFVRPCEIDQRVLVALDAHLLAAADGFDAIELSPVAPLGTCSTLAPTDQNRTLGALRATEVASDPTNVLALECAERLPRGDVHLATCMRVVRAQPVPKLPGYAAHFRIFCLASGGRERGDHGFAVDALVRHVEVMQRALDRLERDGYAFGARRVEVLARADRAALADRLVARVGGSRGVLDHAYYSGGVRYRIWVTSRDGAEVPLIDGGVFDWLAKLTSNQRNVFVASGMGAQLVAFAFRA